MRLASRCTGWTGLVSFYFFPPLLPLRACTMQVLKEVLREKPIFY
jgi:hypothetical protein